MVYTRIVQPGVRSKYNYKPGERTIFRVAGTIIPRVWKMCLFTAVLTWLLCLAWDPLHRAEKTGQCHVPDWLPSSLTALWDAELLLHLFRDMEKVLAYFTGFLTFILGFFNSITFSR